jgi:hypothetical protein
MELVYWIGSTQEIWILIENMCNDPFFFSCSYIDNVAPTIRSKDISIEIVGTHGYPRGIIIGFDIEM